MCVRDLHSRLAATYVTALKSQQESGTVSIHVGQEIWDGLRAMADQVSPPPLGDTLFGFPILLEAAWEPDRIEVRVAKTIF